MSRNAIGVLLICVFTASTWAKGPADKVTGDFLRVWDDGNVAWECEVTAHEAKDIRTQKGSIYCARTEPEPPTPWNWEVMLGNDLACVVIEDDAVARVGGIVTGGTIPPGRFFGFSIFDYGEPGVIFDELYFHSFGYNDELFWEWCEFGGELGNIATYTLGEGNIQVHYYDQ